MVPSDLELLQLAHKQMMKFEDMNEQASYVLNLTGLE
jgi:hypothetical protein